MSRGAKLRFTRLCCTVFAVCALAACAAPVTDLRSQPAVDLRWPSPPFPPRIQWVRNIANPEDAGITKGFWARTLEFFTGADGSRIVRPYGVLLDRRDRLIISDPGAGVVHVIDGKRNRYQVITGEDGMKLRTPIGVAEDTQNRLYITDSTSGELYRYDLGTEELAPFHVPMLQRPTGIVYNPANALLYIVDTLGNEVVAVDLEGREKRRFSSSFNHPTDICADSKGQLYVTDPLTYKIKVFTPEGALITQLGTAGDAMGNLNKPKGVAVDKEGHIYVSDSMLDAVQVFDASGNFLMSFGSTGTGNGEFWMPSGMYMDHHDYLLVADTYNRRIQVFRYLQEAPSGGAGAAKTKPGAK